MAGRVAFPQSVITRVRILVYVFAACIASADSFHHAGTAPASGVPVAARNRCPRGLDARSGSILGLYKRQIYYHTSSRSVGPFPVPGFLGSRRTRYSEAQMQPWSSPASAKIGSPAGGNVASRAKEEHIKIMLGKRVGPASCQVPSQRQPAATAPWRISHLARVARRTRRHCGLCFLITSPRNTVSSKSSGAAPTVRQAFPLTSMIAQPLTRPAEMLFGKH